jgi:phosphinothricin acetyltransferase
LTDRQPTPLTLRVAHEDDAESILEIYEPIVSDTTISFELETPSLDEMRRRLRDTLETHPWLVCEEDGMIAGYAHAGPFHWRPAYRWAAEVAVYVRSRFRGRGVGRALYSTLMNVLTRQGYVYAHAAISLPNPVSVGLHEGLDFKEVGVLPNVGYKQGKWTGVGYWRRDLAVRGPEPSAPVPFTAFRNSPELEAALRKGSYELKV